MNRNQVIAVLFLLALCTACSLTPDRPVTRQELMNTRIYSTYVIVESPDEVLDALNQTGEVVLEAKRTIRGVDYPTHIKILATSDGLEVLDYDR